MHGGTESSLYTAVAKAAGLRAPFLQDYFTTSLSPILVILSWISYLPILHRKAILDFCRIQAPIRSNATLSRTFNALADVHASAYDTTFGTSRIVTMTTHALINFLETIYPFPLLASLLSYFVRAELPCPELIEEFQARKKVSLDKELSAALYYQSEAQNLDYRHILFGLGTDNLHPQLPYGSDRVRALYERGLQQIAQHFSSFSARPILPRYNSRKNVSYQTAREYYSYLASGSELGDVSMDVTTLDLLRLYYLTGYQTPGPLEMRQAWFFNNLDPRTYYCMGGDAFFAGIHIQDIANLFCEILPSTNPFSRFTVSRIGRVGYNELLITYDYSSFTTTLAELKYFLFWLSERVEGIVVTVLDVREGLKEVSLSSLLREYNDMVNRHQVFSIERFSEGEAQYELRQGRSGSLGVKGNIVFSTTLHGLALAEITGSPDEDCCVGDDALARVRAWLLTIFITCVNNLGSINPEKFTTISRVDENESALPQQYKFLKRPLNLDPSGLPLLGTLDFFPNFAEVLRPLGDGIHTATPSYSSSGRAKTFAMQVGRFLTTHCVDPCIILREEDMELVLTCFRMAYEVLGLPSSGGIPGRFTVGKDHIVSTFLCPPVDTTSVFQEHWLETLLFRFHGQKCTLPVTVGSTIPPPWTVMEGQTFNASSDVACLQLLVDLRVLEAKMQTREAIFDWSLLEELEAKLVLGKGREGSEPYLYEYTVVSTPPFWWYDLVMYEYPELVTEDPQEAWARVASIMSGSSI